MAVEAIKLEPRSLTPQYLLLLTNLMIKSHLKEWGKKTSHRDMGRVDNLRMLPAPLPNQKHTSVTLPQS